MFPLTRAWRKRPNPDEGGTAPPKPVTGRTDKGKGECQTPQAREPFWRESCVGPNRARLQPAPNALRDYFLFC